MAVTITWDGNTTGLVSAGDGLLYKVSNRVFSKEELLGGIITISDGTTLTIDDESKLCTFSSTDGRTMYVALDAVVSSNVMDATEFGVNISIPEDGTYFVRDIEVYVASITLPNAEEEVSHITISSGDGYALYNGVKLPNISLNDDFVSAVDSLPFCFFISSDAGYIDSSYVGFIYSELYLCSISLVYDPAEHSLVSPDGAVFDAFVFVFTNNEELASSGNFDVNSWNAASNVSFESIFYNDHFNVWANYTILSSDSSIFVPATAPIPLDGMNVIEWDGVTDGLEVFAEGYYKIADFSPASAGVVVSEISGSDTPGVVSYFGELQGTAGSWAIASGSTSEPVVYGIHEEDATTADVSAGIYAKAYHGTFPDGGTVSVWASIIAYTPATEEPEDTSKKDFWNGVACGLCGSGTPNFSDTSPFGVGYITGCKLRALRERKPIAYLYNGVRLPDINAVWTDKSTYTWAGIAVVNSNRMLFLSSAPFQVDTTQGVWQTSADCTYSQYLLSGEQWVYDTSYDLPANSILLDIASVELGWCNGGYVMDVSTNTIYLAASDPVPVYE